MDEVQESQSVDCEALPDGTVKFSVSRSGELLGSLQMPPDKIADVIAALLSASVAAGKLSGKVPTAQSGESLYEIPSVYPSSMGLMQGVMLNSGALMLQFGATRIAVRMADKEMSALGQALSTMTARRDNAQ